MQNEGPRFVAVSGVKYMVEMLRYHAWVTVYRLNNAGNGGEQPDNSADNPVCLFDFFKTSEEGAAWVRDYLLVLKYCGVETKKTDMGVPGWRGEVFPRKSPDAQNR